MISWRSENSMRVPQGNVLNGQRVAADGINRKAVETHFDLLEDLLLAVRLPANNPIGSKAASS